MSANKKSDEIHVNEAENDFPLDAVTFLRIGSAHAQAMPSREDALLQFLRKVRNELAEDYEPEAVTQPIEIVYTS